MRGGQADLHALAGAYALDAVPDGDRARFERHLGRCEACAQEIRGLREAIARLGASAAVRPRAELKHQALRAIAQHRELGARERLAEAREQDGRAARLRDRGQRLVRWHRRDLPGQRGKVAAVEADHLHGELGVA